MASARFTPVTVSVAVWIPLFASLVVGSHLSLGTNAYDLSVFDYALWNTVQGDPGHVPFFGYSLFAQHFMPSLLALLPAYLLAPSPLTLIWLQIAAIVVAAILLDRLIPTSFPMLGRWALLIAFLFSRRSYSAFSSVFYLESMEPALIFGLLLAWKAKRWLWYWAVLILALGCKEDVALYIASFGIIQIGLGQRRIGLATALFASVWLIFAVGFAIPQARAAEGLPIANPFLVARYSDVQHGETQSIGAVFARVVSARGVGKVVTLTSAVLFCCWAAPTWLAVAALGIVLNLAARPDTLQSGLNGHYLWPILPWLYFAAIQGASRVSGRWPQLVTPFFIVLIAFTLADSPALRRISSLNQQSQESFANVRACLAQAPVDARVAAMPNLVPHLPHMMSVSTLGRAGMRVDEPQYIYISTAGDLWPYSAAEVAALVEELKADRRYTASTCGPLITFQRVRDSTS